LSARLVQGRIVALAIVFDLLDRMVQMPRNQIPFPLLEHGTSALQRQQ
jgi:hypothetical protein